MLCGFFRFFLILQLVTAPVLLSFADDPKPAEPTPPKSESPAKEPTPPPNDKPENQPKPDQPNPDKSTDENKPADSSKGTTPDKPDTTTTPPPVIENQPQPSPEELLLEQLKQAMKQPVQGLKPDELHKQLESILANAAQLEKIIPAGPLKLQAASIQLQATYALIMRYPNHPDNAQRQRALRTLARRTKTITTPNAKAIGDFWLMTIDLFEINQLDIPLDQKRAQSIEAMEDYLARHKEGEPVVEVTSALNRLKSTLQVPPIKPPASDINKPKPPANILTPPEVLGPKTDDKGVIHFQIKSPLQSKPTELRVILPERVQPDLKYPVLYLLPVEAGLLSQYGDPIRRARLLDIANKHKIIVISPSFAELPWYADHPTRNDLKQETYFTKVVVPLVDKLYPVDPKRRLLLGFSKSGNGAVSLILRNPDIFSAAAAWDAPFMEPKPNKYGMKSVYETQENYEQYRIPDLIRTHANLFGKQKERIAILGYGNFRRHIDSLHQLMTDMKIPHYYKNGPSRRHHWDGGWVDDAVKALIEMKL